GRPDLLERSVGVAQTSTSLARQLYRSLERLRGLPEFVQVLPGHGAGSACGKSLGAVPQSVIGYELRFNPAFGMRDEIRFVRDILAGQPDPPPYFARMKRLNQMGPPPSPGVPQRRSAGELPEALHSGLRILDTRPADVYAAGHLTGSINIPFDQAFLTWAGWLIDGEEPLGLIAPADQIDACCRELALIGIDHLSGAWDAAVLERMPVAGCALASISRRQAAELYELVVSGQATVIDVRRHAERAEGKIAGSLGIPLANLAAAAADLPAGPLIVHCQGGVRSPIAASMLTAAGHRTVIDMVDGYSGWEQVMRRRRA
ncbi:MAG TPA: rhodanese-like domain-containing protein, partial [Roseiflexaceae bacterium]|nr:rhodanese-like domain-containing protein [Roseiflexaceae bacterium]